MNVDLDNPYIDPNGRKLGIGVFVEVDTNDPGGLEDFGQITAGPDANGIWEYCYLAGGVECNTRAFHSDMYRYHPEPKQTEAARATRRKLRALGYRINRTWGDGLVKMTRGDGVFVTTRLDGSIRVSSEDVLYATADLIGRGFTIASSKGMGSS